MNHILVKIEGDELENMKSYNDISLEIAKDVETSIVNFIKNLK